MNLVDSCGWLEYFADAPNADFFAGPLEDVDRLVVPTISISEVFKVMLRGRDEDSALLAVGWMRQGLVVELDATIAMNAARIGLDARLPLADSVILASARAADATLWTQDAHFAGIEGVMYVPRVGFPS